MNIISKIEKKFGRYSIRNLTLYLIIGYGIGYLLFMFQPKILFMLTLDPAAVMHGQVWRPGLNLNRSSGDTPVFLRTSSNVSPSCTVYIRKSSSMITGIHTSSPGCILYTLMYGFADMMSLSFTLYILDSLYSVSPLFTTWITPLQVSKFIAYP